MKKTDTHDQPGTRFLPYLAEYDDVPCEVIDSNNRPLMVMPYASIARQRLFCRMVVVSLRNSLGQIFLLRRPLRQGKSPHRRGLFTSPVQVNEAAVEAATRLVALHTGIAPARPVFSGVFSVPAWPAHNMLFEATLPGRIVPVSKKAGDCMAVDREELEGLIRGMPELAAPELLAAHAAGLLFPAAKGRVAAT